MATGVSFILFSDQIKLQFKFMKRAFFFILLFMLPLWSISQIQLSTKTINATGAQFKNDNYSIDYSIGELTVIQTAFTPGIVITAGLLQPTRWILTNSNNTSIDYIKVLPTFVQGNTIYLEMTLAKNKHLDLRLINVLGQQLAFWKFTDQEDFIRHSLQLPILMRGSYFLELWIIDPNQADNTEKKLIRIQKQ